MSTICVICSQPGKYKCPQCPSKYCSILCFKQHKESCATTSSVSSSEPPTPALPDTQCGPKIPPQFANNERVKQLFIDRHLETTASKHLNAEHLSRLLSSESIYNSCQDTDLQRIIYTIANAPQQQLKILLLRHQLEFNHDFVRFVEALLSTILDQHASNGQEEQDAMEQLKDVFDIR